MFLSVPTTYTQWTMIVVGTVFSIFYGLRAVSIFVYPHVLVSGKKNWFCVPHGRHPKSWYIHQIWINFLGSVVGWVSVYVLHTQYLIEALKFTPSNVFLFVVAMLGIMGFLPYTFWSIASLGGLTKFVTRGG